jgi:hypothetical protein
MSKTTIAVGLAPKDSQVEEWDWSEDDDGFRFKSYYSLIPAEIVETVEVHETKADNPFEKELEFASGVAKFMFNQYNGITPAEIVFQVTVSAGDSFVATAWNTLSETLRSLQS